MKIYLAGPMTGFKDHNHPAFHAAAVRIRARGHECINPAELIPNPAALALPPRALWVYSMRLVMPHLLTCNAVAVLPRWLESDGSRQEVFTAAKLDMPIMEESTWRALSGHTTARAILIKELLAYPAAEQVLPTPSPHAAVTT